MLVDTSAFYAICDRDDRNHAAARQTWNTILDSTEPIRTTNYVLIETWALLQRRLGVAAVRCFQEDLSPVLNTHWLSATEHAAAAAAVLAASRRDLSLVDCASFLVMRNLGERKVFTFDRHFREQGFENIPSVEIPPERSP